MSDSNPTSAANKPAHDAASMSAYLSHPKQQQQQQHRPSSSSSTTDAAAPSGNRLYIGNLHPTVDEYVLIQTFSKYGKIAKLDFLFHKAGPMKGKPRGYAFLEYSKKEEALQAIVETHNRTLRGRPLSVTLANQTQHTEQSHSSGGSGPHRRRDADVAKTTTLSLIKNASLPDSTNAKISAMEAKLAKLREGRTKPAGTASGSPSPAPDGGKGVQSLPPKPPSTSGSGTRDGLGSSRRP